MLRASSSKDDGEGAKAKRPKTEHNCTCVGKCKTNRCFCVKEKRGCGSSCKCKSKCENVFSHLDYFFGQDETCNINPCFGQWLLKNAKNGIEVIDRNLLRDRIICSDKWDNNFVLVYWKHNPRNHILTSSSLRRSHNCLMRIIIYIFSFSEWSLADEWEDKEYKEDKEDNDGGKNDISKIQELFREVFSNSSDFYYSFCNDNLLENDSYWHCDKCNKCKWFRSFVYFEVCGCMKSFSFV